MKIISTTESFDLSDDNGQLIFSILANFAARERRSIIQRTLGGKRAGAKAGRFTGGFIPFGYRLEEDTGKLAPDDTVWWDGKTKAEVVRLVFDLYLELRSSAEVAQWLTAHGVPAPRTSWNPTTINAMIRNPVYKGDLAWGKRSHRLHQRSRVNPASGWIVCEGAHAAIVPADIWRRCAAEKQRRRRGGRRESHPPRLLDGFLQCAVCGSALSRRLDSRNQTIYYTCASRYNAARCRNGTACLKAPFWPESKLSRMVWGHIRELVTSGEIVRRLQEEAGDREALLARLERESEKSKTQLEQIIRKEERLIDLALTGSFSQEALSKKQQQLREERERAKQRVEEIEEELRQALASAPVRLDLAAVQERLRGTISDDIAVQREILATLLDGKISVTNDGDFRMRLKPLALVAEHDKQDAPTRQYVAFIYFDTEGSIPVRKSRPPFEEVRRLNAEGLTLKEIADRYGTHWSTIRRMFWEHGEPWLNRQGFQRLAREEIADKVRRLKDEGRSTAAVAAILGTSPKRVRRIVAEIGEGVRAPRLLSA